MPFASDLHPEFGYLGSAPRVFRRLGLVLSFVAFGIVAGASGLAVFMTSPDSDPVTSANPLDAMALAPSEAMIDPKPAQPATQSHKKPANGPDEEGATATPAGSSKPTCRESLGAVPEGDCTPIRVVRVRPLRSANERPLIAAVPIGQRDDPTMVPAPPATAAAVSPSPVVAPEEPKALGPRRHLLSRRRLLTQPPPLSLLLQPPRQRSPPKTRDLEFVTRRMSSAGATVIPTRRVTVSVVPSFVSVAGVPVLVVHHLHIFRGDTLASGKLKFSGLPRGCVTAVRSSM